MPSLLQDANCWSFRVFIFSFGWAQTQNAPIQHGAVAKYSNRCAHWDFHPELSVGTALYMPVSLFMAVSTAWLSVCSWLCMAVGLFMTVHGCQSVHDCAWPSVCSWLRMAISLFMIVHGHQSVHGCTWLCLCSWLFPAVLHLQLQDSACTQCIKPSMYILYKAFRLTRSIIFHCMVCWT